MPSQRLAHGPSRRPSAAAERMACPHQDVSFIIGPPGPADLKLQVSKWAAHGGGSIEAAWRSYVHAVIRSICERESEASPTRLDDFFSRVFNRPVAVQVPHLGTAFLRGHHRPTMVIVAGTILARDRNSFEPELLKVHKDTVASTLGLLLKADWVMHV